MKRLRGKLRILGTGLLILGVAFFGTAAVGWQREQHDVKSIRAHFRQQEAEIRSAIEEIGDGVPLKSFNELLPAAYSDDEGQEWIIRIPTGYDENPSYTNTYTENKYFTFDGSMVRPNRKRSSVGCRHGDRFGPGGVRYYFQRAWHSSADFYLALPASE